MARQKILKFLEFFRFEVETVVVFLVGTGLFVIAKLHFAFLCRKCVAIYLFDLINFKGHILAIYFPNLDFIRLW